MTSERSVCRTLAGAKVGSIRCIRYKAHPDELAPGSLEIETKTGRIVHVTPTGDGACRIARGPLPAPPEATAATVRHWTDLTAEIPFAFDGRPVIAQVEPVRRGGGTSGCVIEFSNGGRLTYTVDHEGGSRLVIG